MAPRILDNSFAFLGNIRAVPPKEDKMGCKDGGPPEKYTEQQLSRVRDALQALRFEKELLAVLWNGLPDSLKFEYNWSRWTYRPQGG